MRQCLFCVILGLLAGCGGSDNPAPSNSGDEPSSSAEPSAQHVIDSDSDSPSNSAEAGASATASTDKPDSGQSSVPDVSDSSGDNATETTDADAGKEEPENPDGVPNPAPVAEIEFPDATKLPADLLASKNLTALNPQKTVFIDVPGKRVLLKTNVCLDRGMLEMFLCLKQTKEHESILTLNSKAFAIHTALLALGVEEGEPAKYEPEYVPPKGQVIDVFVHWADKEGKLHRQPASNWVRHSRYKYYEAKFETLPADLRLELDGNLRYDDMNEVLFWYGPMTDEELEKCLAMSKDAKFQAAIRDFHRLGQPRGLEADFIFVGSGFLEDPDRGRRYLAEGGYVICVANFNAAMIDISIPSSAAGQETLSFEAWSERLPPLGSEVLVELVPRFKQPTDRKEPNEAPALTKPGDDAETSGE